MASTTTTSSRPHHLSVRQLSNGLLVSGGPPEPPPRDRPPIIPSLSAPYTGGDLRRSGDLTAASCSSSRSHSGPLPKRSSSSSGPLSQIPATGLITGQNPNPSFNSSPNPNPRRNPKRKEYGTSVTEVRDRGPGFRFAVPRVVIWAGAAGFLMVLGVAVLVMVVVGGRLVILAGAAAAGAAGVGAVWVWNWGRGREEVERFLRASPDSGIDPRNLPVGQIVKVTGVICHFVGVFFY